jgi:predicted nucleic acid-binding Zn ribbon protein
MKIKIQGNSVIAVAQQVIQTKEGLYRRKQKNKISKTVTRKHKERPKKKNKLYAKDKYTLIDYSYCVCCSKLFVKKRYSPRKTCSEQCRVETIMKNRKANTLRSKRSSYYNCWEDKSVWLDSSWELEVAQLLDSNNIKWKHPKSIKYILKDKEHLYFPDFHLPDHKIYLDPKNPLVMEIDKAKLEVLTNINKVNLIFGHIDKIKKEILKLT